MRYTYQIKISPDREKNAEGDFLKAVGAKREDFREITIRKKSIDARKKPLICYLYTFEAVPANGECEKKLRKSGAGECPKEVRYQWPGKGFAAGTGSAGSDFDKNDRPVIIGFGPAGMFAALYLARGGMRPVVIERGDSMKDRIAAVEAFHKGGNLRTDSNVQFGEGGAGTFSDGKLNTGVKDKNGRNRAVLETFVEFGAPEDILYDSRAHIGTDVIRQVVVGIRKEIERLGGEIFFRTRFVNPKIENGALKGIVIDKNGCVEFMPCRKLIMAIGHSSRDTYETLYHMDFPMEAKSFAVGFRVIHKAQFINESQYGTGYGERYKNLPTAYYKLAKTTSKGRNVYSFCMCPGGYVVDSSSEEKRLAINGMSNSKRDGEFSNAAIVMNVGPEDFKEYGENAVLSGIEFQRDLEEKAFRLGEGAIPVQFYEDFRKRVISKDAGNVKGADHDDNNGNAGGGNFSKEHALYEQAFCGDFKECDLTKLFSGSMNEAFVEGMEYFNTCIKGYTEVNPVIAGVESRTSAPLRILRDEFYECTGTKGIYPCGEGAGYAGGITSAAMDGLKCAEALYASVNGKQIENGN